MNFTLRAWYIRHRANKRKWSARALANKLGICRSTLYYWLRGVVEMPERNVQIIQDYLTNG